MKNLFLSILMACTLATGFTQPLAAHGVFAQKRVFTVDHDDVINTKEKLGTTDYAKFIPIVARIAWNHPRGALALIWNARNIKARGEEIAKTVSGTSNIICALAQELKKEGYPDLTGYAEEITDITVKPKPIQEVVDLIKDLKKQGYTIIGATNQDYHQNKAFRKKMSAQGVNVEELFDGVLVAHTILKSSEVQKGQELHEIEPGIFMPASSKGYKPNFEYFTALKKLAKTHAPKANSFVHIDDKLENIEGAQKVKGFAKSLHLKLPEDKSARRCTKKELQAAIAELKANIAQLNSKN